MKDEGVMIAYTDNNTYNSEKERARRVPVLCVNDDVVRSTVELNDALGRWQR